MSTAESTNIGVVVIVFFFAVIAITVLAWSFSATQRLKRALRSTRRWPIGQLPENTVGRVVGRAHPIDRTLTAPLTGRPCLYYVARVEEHRSSGKRSHWRTIISEANGVPFRLVDPTGHAIVDPNAAQVALTFDSHTRSGTMDDATPAEEAFLGRHGHVSKGWVFNKKLRYTEAVIEIDEAIAVLGSGVREGDPMALPPEGYRSAPPTRLRLTSSPRFPLVISDDPSTIQG